MKNVKPSKSSINLKKDIAVIGMACRFPGAKNYKEFWYNISNGISSIKEIDRWDFEKVYSDQGEENKCTSKWMGVLDDIYKFDNSFFNISPREAMHMDPQQRILLEQAWHCIEDSGVPLKRLQERNTAVHVGSLATDPYYKQPSPEEIDIYSGTGNYPFMLSNRISYFLGLNGVSKTVDTACSSALVVLHDARVALATGESDFALVAGINLHFSPLKYLIWSKNRMLSPAGKCKTFDKGADGFVAGEGVGVLLLQPLEQAIADKNHIYGVIKGCAVNHGGKASSISAPRVEAQRDVILSAYEDSGFSPNTVSYIEAHGTGTSLGDPIEIEALTQAFHQYNKSKNSSCKIGSVKTNIGHLMAASGMPSIIKVLLMMQHKKIAPSLNMEEINPIIDFDNSPFNIATSLSEWKSPKKGIPLRAGVSSFGYGGVNCHALLEEFCDYTLHNVVEDGCLYPFILSAKTPQSLKNIANDWKALLKGNCISLGNFRDICLTLLTGREAFSSRYGKLVKDKSDILQMLENEFEDSPSTYMKESRFLRIGENKWGFYSEWQLLCKEYPIFKEKADKVLDAVKEFDCDNKITKGFFQDLWPKPYIGLYSFILTYSSISVLMDIGFSFDTVTGCKDGLWTALAISKILSLNEILMFLSGKLEMKQFKPTRPEISFYNPVSSKEIKPFTIDSVYLEELLSDLRIPDSIFEYYMQKANILYSNQYTFKKYIEEWGNYLKPAGLDIKKLLNEQDYLLLNTEKSNRKKLLLMIIILGSLHRLNQKWNLSQRRLVEDDRFYELMDLVMDEIITKDVLICLLATDDFSNYEKIVMTINERINRINRLNINNERPYNYLCRFSSNITEIDDFEEWVKKMLSLMELPTKPNNILIDFGNLTGANDLNEVIAINSVGNLTDNIKEAITGLWLKGIDIEWDKLYPENSFSKISLPVYSFEQNSFWLPEQPEETKNSIINDSYLSPVISAIHPLLHKNASSFSEYKFSSEFTGNEFFIENCAKGQKNFPKMAYIEMAQAAINYALDVDFREKCNSGKSGLSIKNVVWGEPIVIGANSFQLNVGLYPEENKEISFEIYSGSSENGSYCIHAQGSAERSLLPVTPVLDIEAVKIRCNQKTLSSAQCDEVFSSIGMNLGLDSKVISKIYAGSEEVLTQLNLPSFIKDSETQFMLHPSIISSVIRSSVVLPILDNNFVGYMLSSIQQLDIYKGCSSEMWALIKYTKEYEVQDKGLKIDINIYNKEGIICIKMKGIHVYLEKNAIQVAYSLVKREMRFLCKQWELGESVCNKSGNERVVILATEETKNLANNLEMCFLNCKVIDYSTIESELLNSTDEWKTYDGVIDLVGCGSMNSDSIGWIKWIQRLIELGRKEGLMLLCVTKGLEAYTNKNINLSGALHAGLFRMIQSEYSHLRSRHMDGELTINDKDLALQIAKEFYMEGDDSEVCYRNEIRYKAFLGDIKEYKSSIVKNTFHDNHVLLITGGTRGLGYLCAQHFVKEYGVKRLVLTGREEIPPRNLWDSQTNDSIIQKIKAIRYLEAQGVQVMVMSISLTEPQSIKESLMMIKNTLGPIGGVIHCAGLTDSNNPAFIRKSMEDIELVLSPKVKGLNLLYESLINEPLQFFVLFSSVSAIVPTLATGQSDYSMANSYMDYFAEAKNSSYPVISIRWPSWKETGMGEVKSRAYQQTGLLSHTNAEGLAMLDQILSQRIMSTSAPAVLPVIVNPDLCRPEQLMKSIIPKNSIQNIQPQGMVTNEVPKVQDFVMSLAHSWLIKLFSEELNIDPAKLEIDTPFQKFGIDSIFLAQIVRRMEKEIKTVSIEPSSLLEYPTIKDFADYLADTYPRALNSMFANQERLDTDHSHKDTIMAEPSKSSSGLLNDVEKWLIRLFSQELNISPEKLDIDRSFQYFGIDSIFLAQIVRKMDKVLGDINVDPSAFLDYPSIQELARFMIETYPEALKSLSSGRVEVKESTVHTNQTSGKMKLTSLLRKRYPESPTEKPAALKEKVAIVGIGCHYPEAANIEEYWNNLRSGRDSICEIPKSRWDGEKSYCQQYKEGKSISKWGGFLENIYGFDNAYFKISESLAPQIDPLQRQWLEVSVEALADAGFDKETLWGKHVGVFVGARTGDFSQKLGNKKRDTIVGTGQNFIAVHLAQFLNFKGPNMVVDTACSSSLTAIHLAVKSIQNGESEIALAGGVDILDESVYQLLSAAKILSPDGRCKAFDAGANGIGIGEGCGIIVLKLLSKAIQNNDKIYGVIDGTAINCDGNTMGITTPNPEAQRELIEKVIADTKINPETISYVETHGTGTLIGDPIELRGLTKVFEKYVSKKQFCGVGSVKSNIGHLLSASGSASIIKVLLSIIHQQLPPTIHCDNPNPRFNFKESPLYLVKELTPWKTESNILRAGISAFGLGGNNAHIIVSNEGVPDMNKATLRPKGEKVVFNRTRHWPEEDKEDIQREYLKSENNLEEMHLSSDEQNFMDFFYVEVVE